MSLRRALLTRTSAMLRKAEIESIKKAKIAEQQQNDKKKLKQVVMMGWLGKVRRRRGVGRLSPSDEGLAHTLHTDLAEVCVYVCVCVCVCMLTWPYLFD